MILVVVMMSVVMVGIGLFGLISPIGLADFVARWQSAWGLWAVAGLRLLFGIALWRIAPISLTPLVLQVLAGVTLAAGLTLPLVGVTRFIAMLSWWRSQSPGFIRAWTAVVLILGGFVLWSVSA